MRTACCALLLVVATAEPISAARAAKASAASATPTFRGIGDLPGGAKHSEALAVSDDGKVVVGRSGSERSAEEGFIIAGGKRMTALLASGAPTASEPRALTPDGATVAGKIAMTSGGFEAARWSAGTGWVGLGDVAGGAAISQALGISSDGSVLVGWGASAAGYEAVRWVEGKPVAMGDLPGGSYHSAAALVSGDGKTIVGTGNSEQGPEIFLWSTEAGMRGLGDLPGGKFSSEPFGMTPDASVIVGEGTSDQGVEAVRWTSVEGMQGLGDLPGGTFHSTALDVSADGAVVVGFGNTASSTEAFVWDKKHGMRRVEDVLVAAGLTEVGAWVLTEVTGVSADGRTLIGNGQNPDGDTEGWVARLP